MFIVGKFVGAVLGFKAAKIFSGDPAAYVICGLIFGHLGDAILQEKIQKWRAERYWKQRQREERNRVFFQSMFSMLGKLVAADGPVTVEENAAVEKVMTQVLKLNRRARKEAMQIFRYGQVSATSFEYEAARFSDAFVGKPESFENALAMLFTVAMSDGNLKVSEESLIRSAAILFHYPEDRYIALRRSFVSSSKTSADFGSQGYGSHAQGQRTQSNGSYGSSNRQISNNGLNCYEVLGCSPQDPESIIKQRYRKLVSDFHPDKIVSKGLPDEFMKFADEKFKSIQQAYEEIKSQRGF